ncbi:MAG: histidine kinase [Sulfuritalea sp.]|nr:histidine kinase [Sulfuritalea sp.]
MIRLLDNNGPKIISYIGAVTALVLALYLSSLYSYLLFHSFIEIVTIAIAFTLFILTWNTRAYLGNSYLRLLGIGYGFIALIDLIHALAYKGMDVFPGYGSNLPTQLWIAARYLQAVTLLVAPLFAERRVNDHAVFGGYAAAVLGLVATIFSGNFPDCFIEGTGLTAFKIGSEYLISALLLASLFLLYGKRKYFNDRVFFLAAASIACTALSEISFTAYVSVYGIANLVGHFSKLAAFYLIYRAILVTGLKEPIDLVFRDLKQAKDALRKSHDSLEEKIGERTAELHASEQKFRSLAENSPDLIVRYDLDCRRTYVNAAYLRETEVPAGAALNVMLDAAWRSDVSMPVEEYVARLRQVMETGEPTNVTLSWPRSIDGSIVHHAFLIVPERAADGQVKGALSIGRNITALVEAERLLEDSRAQLRDLAVRREAETEVERRRIAHELHDELGQNLSALRFSLNLLDYQFGRDQPNMRAATANLLGMVDKIIQVARDVSSSLRPAALNMGIVPALEWLTAQFSRHAGIPCDLEAPPGDVRMREEQSVAVFRIVQELLTDAARDATAERIQIVFECETEACVIEIRHDGSGFDTDDPPKQKSLDLVGIRERATAVGGAVDVSSAPGRRTVIRVRIPVVADKEGEI